MKSESTKLAFLSAIVLFSLASSGATTLNNIESITPAGSNPINITGTLNMQGNPITNFFGSSCNNGEVVVKVNDDGSVDCVDATSEVQNDFVDRSGDSMTGTLDMQSNSIIGISNLGGSEIVNSGNIASGAVTPTELDETASYGLGWSNLAISQSDISVADLGAADSNLNMNGNSITNAGSISAGDIEASNSLQLPVGTDSY